ncbi:hypothetical protein ACR9E3_13725 [Actinomycetospora sp. C-140]
MDVLVPGDHPGPVERDGRPLVAQRAVLDVTISGEECGIVEWQRRRRGHGTEPREAFPFPTNTGFAMNPSAFRDGSIVTIL